MLTAFVCFHLGRNVTTQYIAIQKTKRNFDFHSSRYKTGVRCRNIPIGQHDYKVAFK